MLGTKMNASRLETLEQLATEAGAEHLATEVHALSDRVRSGLFNVVCVGQFKRGKSTLLNALIGDPVLPMGVVPVTAVVTILGYGRERRVRVRFEGHAWQDVDPEALAEYVSEKANPENRKGVAAVEVFMASPLLASGMCLVDTPGVGSVFAGNSETTRAFLPHVEAALVVLGADPPRSADELALIGEVAPEGQACARARRGSGHRRAP
jgi:predicted GTPase